MRGKASLLLALLILTPSLAAIFKGDSNVIINADEVLNDNVYIAGNLVTVEGTINGDLIVGGNMVEVNGVVNGDLWVGANQLTINGNVTGDVRSGASSVTINGLVNGELLVGAGLLSLNQDSSVGNINVAAGSVTINGNVDGNITAQSESVTIGSKAVISGYLNYTSDNDAMISNAESISGVVQKNIPTTEAPKIDKFNQDMNFAFFGFNLIGLLMDVITITLVGFVIFKISERKLKLFLKEVDKNYIDNLVKGFGFLVLVPIGVILVFITIIGIPISVIGLTLYGITIYLATVLAAFWVGEKTFEFFKKEQDSLIVQLFVGAIVLKILRWIPFIGWFIHLVIWLLAIGTLIKVLKTSYEECKQKKIF